MTVQQITKVHHQRNSSSSSSSSSSYSSSSSWGNVKIKDNCKVEVDHGQCRVDLYNGDWTVTIGHSEC